MTWFSSLRSLRGMDGGWREWRDDEPYRLPLCPDDPLLAGIEPTATGCWVQLYGHDHGYEVACRTCGTLADGLELGDAVELAEAHGATNQELRAR